MVRNQMSVGTGQQLYKQEISRKTKWVNSKYNEIGDVYLKGILIFLGNIFRTESPGI